MGKYLSVPEIVERVSPDGKPVSEHSVRRWIASGLGTPRVKLKAIRVGKKYFSSAEWVDEFLAAIQNPSLFVREEKRGRLSAAHRRLEKVVA